MNTDVPPDAGGGPDDHTFYFTVREFERPG
jgi:hypothetical protein